MDGYEGVPAREVAKRLPDAADSEEIELGVNAEDRDVERQRLRGDDAIEWIAVVSDQPAGAQGRFGFDR